MGATISPDFMSFEQWLKLNPDITDEEITEECPNCGGFKEVECFHCGHLMDCEECGGTGKIKTSKARELYKEQLERDKKMLEKYAAWSQSEVSNA